MNKCGVFAREIKVLHTVKSQEWVSKTLEQTPDYFFTAAASSSGKYHPACSNQKPGGLLIHVKRAFYIAQQLCAANKLTQEQEDIVLASVLLHDIAKCESYGKFKQYEDHPINAAQYFAPGVLDETTLVDITKCIAYHMGPWTPASIRKPMNEYTLLEWIVYTADYMSSVKDIVTPRDTEVPYAENI